MLEKIREGAQGPLVKVLLFLIILTFAFTGVSAYLGGSADDFAAKVNDTEISRAEFDRAYQNQRAMMEQQYGEMFAFLAQDENYMRQLRQSVLENLIEEQLASELAKKIGITQSTAALREAIVQMPEFQINGQFSNDTYLRALTSVGFTPASFRDYLAVQMNRVMLMQGAFGSEFALPSEVAKLQVLQNELRSGRYATVSASDFMGQVDVTDAEIEEFYFDNQELFEQEEQIRLAYVELDFNDVLARINVTEEDVRAYYDNNPAAFQSRESRRIAHIMVEFGDDEAAARERIDAIYARVQAGEDFAELAASESDDFFSGQEGGDLGMLERGSLDPDIEDAGFALSAEGEVSDVVRSEFGYHIVKLTAFNPPQTTEFAEVAGEIRDNLARVEAEQEYFNIQQELARMSFEIDHTLDVVAEELGLEVKTSPWLRPQVGAEGFDQPQLLAQAFSEEVRELGLNSDLIELDQRSLVIRAEEYQPARILDLADVRDDIANHLQAQEAEALANAYGEGLLAALEAGEAVDLEFTEFAGVRRNSTDVPGAMRQELFRMVPPAEGNTTFSVITLSNGDTAVVALTEVTAGTVDPETQDRVQRQLEGQYAELAYRALLEALKANAKIERRL
ncbi:SurA N-terminal domain-containing protein [Aliidiomarina haloalkalitolerans]|uniref:Periplasmic chaperone PpiD n=1 Tax=Aliidiomarina haloalkalitolerans TaxID=859059 RepID=A0A432VQQ9_9GAMM|nr:SurA N-terminal domain-containing protein [Aliidiomarina haloalkalitolerans]RUO18602.1 peptidylprolyl isomerase [Aliidiomarina haloalkalitolerans]